MASYRYRALDEGGSAVTGTLVAENAEDARARLRQMKLFPESVEPAGRMEAGVLAHLPTSRASSGAHVAVFTRQMAVLLSSGVPMVDALRVLSEQTEHRALARALAESAELVGGGKSLGATLSEYPRFFDRAYVGMVASGEKSGTLDVVLARLADFLERRRLLQSRISTALIYPALLLAMVIALLVFLSAFVVPSIEPLLQQHRRPPPFVTQVLFFLGGLAHRWWWTLPVAVVAAMIAAGWLRRSAWRDRFDAAIFRVPFLGRIWLKSLVARFAASFSTLLRTGVPAVEALEALEKIVPNSALAREIRRVRMDVIEGKDISAGVRNSRYFPPMVAYMIAVGERSGTLSDVLEHVAQSHEMEVEISSRRLLAALEPALILAMAAVVGFIAMSLLITIMEISRV